MTQPAAPQLNALTGARGLAAWFVVFYHVRDAFSDAVPLAVIDVLAKGYLAVDFFFVLSGFVMWLNYGRRFEADGLSATRDFLWRRVARIYPLHFVVLTGTLLLVAALAATGRYDAIRYPMWELPLHYALMQNWGFTSSLSWNDPAWSISTELAAYLLLPVASLALIRLPKRLLFDLAAIGLLCAGLWLFLDLRNAAHLGDGIASNGLVRCLAEFLCGVFVCRIWQQHQSNAMRIASGLAAPSLFVMWLAGLAGEMVIVPALFSVLVLFLALTSSWKANPLASAALVYVGDISYSTYLAHFMLWVVFKLLFVTDAHSVSGLLMVGFFLLTFAVSAALYHLVEQPGRRWLQSWPKLRARKAIEASA